MLPSMPLLFSSSRDSVTEEENKQLPITTKEPDTDILQKDFKNQMKLCISTEIPNFSFESIPEDEKECDDELVLLAENSPFGEKRKLHAQTTPTRKKRKVDTVEPLLEDRNSNDEQANHFAMAYFMRAKGEMDESTFHKFIAVLSELDEGTVNAVSLFKEISSLLSGYPELAEEFVGFLHPHQAMEVDKLTDFLNFEQSWNFFRKLDAFHLNKVNHLLEQHSMNPEITSEAVRSSFLSTFKGHPNISEGFLGLLPDGKPPQSCKEDYEDISDLCSEDTSRETLSIVDSTSRGCVPPECDCPCHSCTTKKFCTFCNVKFSKGQIYVQTGKGLRFAKVTFRGCQQEDVLFRLNPTFYSKPTSRKRTKSSSHHNKENNTGVDQTAKRDAPLAEISKESDKNEMSPEKCANETERLEEDDEILFLKTQLNSDPNTDEQFVCSEDLVLESTNSDELEDFEREDFDAGESSPASVKLDEDSHNSLEQASDTNDTGPETDAGNNLTEKPKKKQVPECNQVGLYIGEELAGSECVAGNSAEPSHNESPLVEVKLEAEEVASKPFIIEAKPEKTEEIKLWTREEDKLILQAFQHQLGTEQTFSKISSLLPSRTVDDIQGRFQVLMNLLEQMTNGCYDASSS